jgi:hypothetical protein
VDTNEAYSPLAGGTVLPGVIPGGNLNTPINFVNFTGAVDMNDGTADSIPTGFTFEYNGIVFNSVNININGWVSFNPISKIDSNPLISSNNNSLFSSELPNNIVAPYWGDHYYRTTEPGYTPSMISYLTTRQSDPNPNDPPSPRLVTFTIEWRNLNVNDLTNPNSVASFQLRIYAYIDEDTGTIYTVLKPTFEFLYGPADTSVTFDPVGAVVGAKDSAGLTHLNALFQTSEFNGDSTRLSMAKTSCWPPPSCTPGVAIKLVPISALASVSNLNVLSTPSIQSYPNPFSQSTTINFSSPESGVAKVTIVNMLGSEVAHLFNGELPVGQHAFTWNAVGMPSGTYWAILRMNDRVVQVPIVLQASE